MFAFGVDVPLVELLIGVLIVSIIILIEITVVLVMLMYKLRAFKRLHEDTVSMAKALERIHEIKKGKQGK